MIILTDNPERENEGDLIFPAETITSDVVNFMIRKGTGIVCLSLTAEALKKLELPLMVSTSDNSSSRGTPFTLSIDARHGITTGVSAADRVKTIHDAVLDPKPENLVKPGHIFPLQAREGGVLERAGHTEGAVDLVRLAGFKPAAVLCEIMNEDGSMTHGEKLEEFARVHQITLLSIDDLVAYRLRHENLIEKETSALLPLKEYGEFTITVIKEKINGDEHVVLTKNLKTNNPLVRIHSACMTGDLFHSLRCDCHQQLHYSLKKISEEGGLLIYLNQEGRGIGLFNKIKAYALQEKGLDTLEANEQLGLPIDSRKYYLAANILRNKKIKKLKLLTNNPEKVNDLNRYGSFDVEAMPLPAFYNEYNVDYLNVKKTKLQHTILRSDHE
ncbi:MAG: 3,4-dihydroxy-2-butanone-4-phosphate synthase [Gammaproteobacteria bacterium]|nr:3,4-dihydroxy-2-butanone-4-phosphate synthase [Gammaproteobacteria bacterium]